ncbi:MAG: hypothetical protein ACM3N7_03480 [Planctomycetaceae bacterium]
MLSYPENEEKTTPLGGPGSLTHPPGKHCFSAKNSLAADSSTGVYIKKGKKKWAGQPYRRSGSSSPGSIPGQTAVRKESIEAKGFLCPGYWRKQRLDKNPEVDPFLHGYLEY